MTWHTHPDASRIVRENWQRSQAFLLTQREPCIQIQAQEIARVDRLLFGGLANDLEAWQRPDSWFIAVLLCRGDDTKAITRYVQDQGLDPGRVHFYLHKDASRRSLRAWAAAGLPLDRVDDEAPGGKPITDWGSLHKLLGLHLNNQILADFLSEYE